MIVSAELIAIGIFSVALVSFGWKVSSDIRQEFKLEIQHVREDLAHVREDVAHVRGEVVHVRGEVSRSPWRLRRSPGTHGPAGRAV